jgi:hypothetical protein
MESVLPFHEPQSYFAVLQLNGEFRKCSQAALQVLARDQLEKHTQRNAACLSASLAYGRTIIYTLVGSRGRRNQSLSLRRAQLES